MIRLPSMYANVCIILLFISISFSSVGQRTNFRFYQYNKENKLDEELVKSTQQDSLGIYYFASDQGVLYLTNDYFVPLSLAPEKSGYFKELFRRYNGDILAVSDDAIYKIKTSYTAGELEVLIECNTDPANPKYPKHLYEDQKKDLWIADYNHIFRYSGGDLVKYTMDEKNLTSSYARSYQFLECDNGKLIVVSQKGWFYEFDSQENTFIESDFKPGFLVHSSFKIGANEFLLGTSEGIIKIIFDFQGKMVHQETISREIVASCFEKLSDHKVLAGTWFQGLAEVELTGEHNVYPVGGFPCFTVNDIFLDDFGKYWVSTNSGAVVMEEKFFSHQFSTANSEYVSSISLTDDDKLVFSGRNQVYQVDENQQIEIIPVSFEGSLNVFKTHNKLSLIGTEQGQLTVLKGKEILLNVSVSDQPIMCIEIPSDKEAWVVANKELFKVNLESGMITNYLDSFKGQRIVQDIKLDDKRNLYIAGEHQHSYLFKYDLSENKIQNISKPIPFELSGDFWIIDLEMNQDTLFLGSSSGLLKYYDDKLEQIDLGDMTNSEINSVAIDKYHSLWMTNSEGVIRKRNSDLSLFTPDQGLPSKTFTSRNLVVDNNGLLWVGTSNGLAFAHITDSVPIIPKPLVYMAKAENKYVYPDSNLSITANSMLLLDVTATIYPQKQNKFQFCTIRGSQKITDWKELSAKNQILISDLPPGNYKICIRCKHEGNYAWSEHQIVELNVLQVWYLRWYTLVGEVLLILLLIVLTDRYSKKKAKKNMLELEKLVSDRTIQLQDANENLVTANIAKDKFLSIIAHDLRNPFNAIRGFSKILLRDSEFLSEDEKNELIETIHQSSDDTFKLLESLLEWANVQKGNFKLNSEVFDLKEILGKNLDIHKSLGSLKELRIVGEFESVKVKADKAMIDTVVRNLLSNAIKYSYPNHSISLRSTLVNGFVVVQVSDEGMGMTDKQVDKLFKIDTVFTSEGTANETGTGFGLMLSKEFVELNDGKIWVESEKDKGSSFYFSIPKL